jgi:hypothetical protein
MENKYSSIVEDSSLFSTQLLDHTLERESVLPLQQVIMSAIE